MVVNDTTQAITKSTRPSIYIKMVARTGTWSTTFFRVFCPFNMSGSHAFSAAKGRGGLIKSRHMGTQGGGVSGKKLTSTNSNYYHNFRSSNSVLCARRKHIRLVCSGILSGLLCRRSGVQFPDSPTLEKCAKGICLCNLLLSTQPNDRETVIEG